MTEKTKLEKADSADSTAMSVDEALLIRTELTAQLDAITAITECGVFQDKVDRNTIHSTMRSGVASAPARDRLVAHVSLVSADVVRKRFDKLQEARRILDSRIQQQNYTTEVEVPSICMDADGDENSRTTALVADLLSIRRTLMIAERPMTRQRVFETLVKEVDTNIDPSESTVTVLEQVRKENQVNFTQYLRKATIQDRRIRLLDNAIHKANSATVILVPSKIIELL
jgi:hypothetical protein